MVDKKDKLKLVQQLLISAKSSIHSAEQIIKAITGASVDASSKAKEKAKSLSFLNGEKVIEGVFDGQKMIGPDNKEYKVPENYASKSKLVEGDVLKLTISEDGNFIFKQITPVARKTAIGTVVKENSSNKVVVDGKSYKVLQASINYYKVNDGDQVTVVIPKEGESEWAAIENVIKRGSEAQSEDVVGLAEEKVKEKEETESKNLGVGDTSDDEERVDVETNKPEGSDETTNNEEISKHRGEDYVEDKRLEESGEGVKELEI